MHLKYEIGTRVKPNARYWEMFRGVKKPNRQGKVIGMSNTPLRTRVVKWNDLKTPQTISIGFLTYIKDND